ncbi:S8 family serine peptidase [Klebsiella pneumoniae]|uniref:S8 family serine peptidase n=1 Tax=Klebsiella pneumoniae TaxID=573 RepID=UPI001C712F56|nr:S8 family serine peptidase [Klebsiella pneumoniae]
MNMMISYQELVRTFPSAASALCARMAARLMAQYPEYRPETIRALITHSAQWTPAMLRMYPARNKSGFAQLIRHCGWGSPDVERALWSVKNSGVFQDSCHSLFKY